MVKIWTEDFHGSTAVRWQIDGIKAVAARITSSANAAFEIRKVRESLANVYGYDDIRVSGDVIGRHWDDMVIVLTDRV